MKQNDYMYYNEFLEYITHYFQTLRENVLLTTTTKIVAL
jgi:hypothetical protein